MEMGDVAAGLRAVERVHTSTVVDRDRGLSLTFTAIPRNAFPGQPPETLSDLAESLQCDQLVELPPPAASFLPHAIACILQDTGSDVAIERLVELLSRPAGDALADIDPNVLAFAEFCSFTPIVPTEESEISPKVMARIVGVGGAVGLATVAGAPIVVAIGAAAGTVVVLSAAVGVGNRIYSLIVP
jgi:hypothetical protein